MKPPGGNYGPGKMNINNMLRRASAAGNESGAVADTGIRDVSDFGAYGVRAGKNNDAGGGYTTARVMSSSPLQLILIMFEQFFGLIPDIKQSIINKSAAAMEPDAERAQAIVEELINSLNFDLEISKDLGAIYYYVRDRILEANIKLNAGVWDDIESVMRPIYEGFAEAERALEPEGKPKGFSAVNPSIVAGITYGQGSLKEIVVNTKSGLTV